MQKRTLQQKCARITFGQIDTVIFAVFTIIDKAFPFYNTYMIVIRITVIEINFIKLKVSNICESLCNDREMRNVS